MSGTLTVRRVESTVFIYSLRDPRSGSIKYVGKTHDLAKRFRHHVEDWHLKISNTPKSRWIKALNREGLKPVMEVLEEVPESTWGEVERRWIVKLRAEGHHLLNGTDGGPGGYSESRFRKAREAKQTTRNTNSGVLGVQHSSVRGFDYWVGQVTKNGKTWTQSFPYTDEGKIAASSWYETAKGRLDQGLEPEVVNRQHRNVSLSGIPGLVKVTRNGKDYWRAATFNRDRKRYENQKRFPFTDEGKTAATTYLASIN